VVDVDKEYTIFCDESDRAGRYYSNFYGGVIVGAKRLMPLNDFIEQKKHELNLHKEVKWEKVSERYLPKYQELVHEFFERVRHGDVKVRVMFRQNINVPVNLSKEQKENEYFMLYYQFIKHCFGLRFLPHSDQGIRVRLYFDQFPDTKEKAEQFKGHLLGLDQTKAFRDTNIRIERENITEVRSHEHAILQCLDIILGSMAFRLNDKHKEKPVGAARRGKKTIAKEKLYRTIHQEICSLRPRFNIGTTTGKDDGWRCLWTDPYRHWNFRPQDSIVDLSHKKER
jgi:hypothetical protein